MQPTDGKKQNPGISDSSSDQDLKPSTILQKDGGQLGCGRSKDVGNPKLFLTLESMNAATKRFCEKQAADKLIWKGAPVKDFGNNRVAQTTDTTDPKNLVSVMMQTVGWGKETTCPGLDFTKEGTVQVCQDRLAEIINGCESFLPRWPLSLAVPQRLTDLARRRYEQNRPAWRSGSKAAGTRRTAFIGLLDSLCPPADRCAIAAADHPDPPSRRGSR